MGYNIEVSFDVLKNGSVTKLLESLKNNAEECFCEQFLEEYEFENKIQFQRRHCVVSVIFSHSKISDVIKFINNIKKNNKLYIELIYDDINNRILYASQYYITQKMDKYRAKEFKIEKRKRSYSNDETKILNTILK
jgi:hypothetical protein